MTRAFCWLFPHPLLTLLLAVVWILLQNEFSAGMALFGVILGIVITKATAIWWPERPGGVHLGRLFSYAMIVLWDIIVANIQVATPEAITVLAGTITLTPGTVSADLSDEGHSLLVHVLHTEDPDSDRDEIKDRYERRLKEIFL